MKLLCSHPHSWMGIAPLLLVLFVLTSCQKRPDPVSLEFRIVEKTPSPNLQKMVFSGWGSSDTFYVHDEILLSGDVIVVADFTLHNGHPAIAVQFNDEGSEAFAEITGDHVGEHLGMFIDDTLVSAPLIRDKILGGRAVIDGDFSREQAMRIAESLDGK